MDFSFSLIDPSVHEEQRAVKVGLCLYSLQSYTHEHWLDHLLASLPEIGIPGALDQHLITMLNRLLHSMTRVRIPIQTAMTENDFEQLDEVVRPEERLACFKDNSPIFEFLRSMVRHRQLIRQYFGEEPVSGTFKNHHCEGLDVEAPVANRMYSLASYPLSAIHDVYQKTVMLLLSTDAVLGLKSNQLSTFKAMYSPYAFTCRFPDCASGVIGFSTEEIRALHEQTHAPPLLCTHFGCAHSLSFRSLNGLKRHVREYHTKMATRIPRSVRPASRLDKPRNAAQISPPRRRVSSTIYQVQSEPKNDTSTISSPSDAMYDSSCEPWHQRPRQVRGDQAPRPWKSVGRQSRKTSEIKTPISPLPGQFPENGEIYREWDFGYDSSTLLIPSQISNDYLDSTIGMQSNTSPPYHQQLTKDTSNLSQTLVDYGTPFSTDGMRPINSLPDYRQPTNDTINSSQALLYYRSPEFVDSAFSLMPPNNSVQVATSDAVPELEPSNTAIKKTPNNTSQHYRILCARCNRRPDGFKSRREFKRHVSRWHFVYKRAFICVDASRDGEFLADCKDCRDVKVYEGYYTAAAHLRRAHFRQKNDGHNHAWTLGNFSDSGDPPMEWLKQNWIQVVEVDNIPTSDSGWIYSYSDTTPTLSEDDKTVSQASLDTGAICGVPGINDFSSKSLQSRDRSSQGVKKRKRGLPYVCTAVACDHTAHGGRFTRKHGVINYDMVDYVMIKELYKCALENCPERSKIWSPLSNSEKHIHRMHKGEDEQRLINRYVGSLTIQEQNRLPRSQRNDC
jgi:hypothetical protein